MVKRTITTTTTEVSTDVGAPVGASVGAQISPLMPVSESSFLHHNYANLIGHSLAEVEQIMRTGFLGTAKVYIPGQVPVEGVDLHRLQIFVDEQNIITKIVNG